MKKIRLIAGATASGKTKAGILWAQKIGGCIINADSLQVYKDVPTLTARPLEHEQEGVPHYLYGLFDCHEVCSVARWLENVTPILKEEQNPIVVGGTGLYLKALMEGLNDIPAVDSAVRAEVQAMSLEEVKSQVTECTAVDSQRLRRALEVQLMTGKSLKWFQNQPKKKVIEADFEVVWIHPPREELYLRCNARFEQMLKNGAIEEVRALRAQNPTGGVTQAIGYKEIIRYLEGELSESQMRDLSQMNTRHYAKRQTTWFKHQLKADKIICNPLDLLR